MAITRTDVLGWNPCDPYDSDRISELIGESETAQGIRDLDIPAQDRLWVLSHAMSLDSQLLLASAIADRLLTSESITDPSAWRTVNALRKCARREVPFGILQSEMRRAQRVAINAQDRWQPIQSLFATSLLGGSEGDRLARTVVWLALKAEALGDAGALDAALDEAVSLLEAE